MTRRGLVLLAMALLSSCTGSERPSEPVSAVATSAPSGSVSSPLRLEDLPWGAATRLPWAQGGTLHVDGTTIHARVATIRSALSTTVVELVTAGARSWHLVHRGRLVRVVGGDATDVVVSPDGSSVAWAEATAQHLKRLVLWDVGRRQRVSSVDSRIEPDPSWQGVAASVIGIDHRSRVLVYVGRRVNTFLMWTPGSVPLPVAGTPRSAYRPWPRGLMFQGRGAGWPKTPGVVGRIDALGRFHRVGRVPTHERGSWSPDGTTYAYRADGLGDASAKHGLDRVRTLDFDSGRDVELRLPTQRRWDVLGWESPTALLLYTVGEEAYGEPTGIAAFVRCDVLTTSCERASDGPTGYARLPG